MQVLYAIESGRLKPPAGMPRHLGRRPTPSRDGGGGRQVGRGEKTTEVTTEEVKGQEARQKRDSGGLQDGPVGSTSEFKAQRGGAIYGGQFSAWVSTWGPGLLKQLPGGLPTFCPSHPLENGSAEGQDGDELGQDSCSEDHRLPS